MNVFFNTLAEKNISHLDKKILKLMVSGSSQLNIANYLGYSERYIREKISELKIRFNAQNVYQLIYYISCDYNNINNSELSIENKLINNINNIELKEEDFKNYRNTKVKIERKLAKTA
jgi:DNA-binding CsgD family transcriptional regulator